MKIIIFAIWGVVCFMSFVYLTVDTRVITLKQAVIWLAFIYTLFGPLVWWASVEDREAIKREKAKGGV